MAADGPAAAVDCGTNSTRLLVADGAGRPLERLMRVTRLGEKVDATGRLDPAAVARTLAVLGEYRRVMDRHGVGRGRLVATSAARDAADAEGFLDEAEKVTGLRPEILTGDEEGRLSFAGATASPPPGVGPDTPVLVVDIGGGSTELVVGVPGRPDQARACSLDLGCVRLTERVLRHDPPTAAELAEARRLADGLIAAAPVDPPAGVALLGLAGTVSTLAALDQELPAYRRDAVHHHRLPRAAVERWFETLAHEPAERRRQRPGMEPGRADVIVGGVAILASVMDRFDIPLCVSSEDDILDGLVASLN